MGLIDPDQLNPQKRHNIQYYHTLERFKSCPKNGRKLGLTKPTSQPPKTADSTSFCSRSIGIDSASKP